MAVLIFMFLVTIIAHSVTSDLECWQCNGKEDKNGKNPCDDGNNFKLKKCKEDEKLCIDMVDIKYKQIVKDCATEKEWNAMKAYAEANNLNGILKKCDKTECNTKTWEDYKICM